jgi:hypothetical protein
MEGLNGCCGKTSSTYLKEVQRSSESIAHCSRNRTKQSSLCVGCLLKWRRKPVYRPVIPFVLNISLCGPIMSYWLAIPMYCTNFTAATVPGGCQTFSETLQMDTLHSPSRDGHPYWQRWCIPAVASPGKYYRSEWDQVDCLTLTSSNAGRVEKLLLVEMQRRTSTSERDQGPRHGLTQKMRKRCAWGVIHTHATYTTNQSRIENTIPV